MLELNVKVKAAAKVDKIEGWQQDADGKLSLKISIRQIPEQGKANQAIIKFLSKALGLPQSAFVIIRGHTSSHKVIGVDGLSREEFDSLNLT